MEIISIDSKVFDLLAQRVEALNRKSETLDRKEKDLSLSEWLDNEDVYHILGVSKRTLLSYRSSGLLPYHQMRYKIYYRSEDVKRILELSHIEHKRNDK